MDFDVTMPPIPDHYFGTSRIRYLLKQVFLPVVLLTVATFAVACYLAPYAFHRVVRVGYELFETPVTADGTVTIHGSQIDFRLPDSALAAGFASRLRGDMASKRTVREQVATAAEFVRSSLAGGDSSMPTGFGVPVDVLLGNGGKYHCICGEYATVFNRVLQASGIQCRVVWLEGHVVTEYFDSEESRWLFADCHMNIVAQTADGELLGVSELIQEIEHDQLVQFERLVPESPAQAQDYSVDDASKCQWLRNVLLNGECRVLSGQTLQASGRWAQLLKFGSRPTILVLQTDYDSGAAEHYPGLSVRRTVFAASLILFAYCVIRILQRDSHPRGDGVAE